MVLTILIVNDNRISSRSGNILLEYVLLWNNIMEYMEYNIME